MTASVVEPGKLTLADARRSLTEHVATKGLEIKQKYGPHIGWNELLRLLEDREYVRYPCEIIFDAAPLLEGEFAYPAPKGSRPEDGFLMYIHPAFEAEKDQAVWLVLYQLVAVNYGPFASADDAETFGATALGLHKDKYYNALCEMAPQI